MSAAVVELAEQIKALMPHERLRLAADLLEKRQPKLAMTIAQSALDEVNAAIAVVDIARTRRPSPSESNNHE